MLVLVIPTPGLELRGLAVVPVPPLVSRPQSAVRRRDRPDRILNFSNFCFGHMMTGAPTVFGPHSLLGPAGDGAGLRGEVDWGWLIWFDGGGTGLELPVVARMGLVPWLAGLGQGQQLLHGLRTRGTWTYSKTNKKT